MPRMIFVSAGLALALILAVAVYYIDRQSPVDAQTQEAFEQNALEATLNLQEQLTLDIDSSQLAEERARAESEEGLKFFGLCNAWIEFHQNHPDESSLANRERACGDYRTFLETGEAPQPTADPGG